LFRIVVHACARCGSHCYDGRLSSMPKMVFEPGSGSEQ
jgi:hypothetical protein